MAQLVELEFGVSYHPSHLGRLLHTRGFSCQKPVRRSREQGPAAVQAWREQK
nr:winged helix-turn-helix domain-containing protein [Pirellulimonas nuda]